MQGRWRREDAGRIPACAERRQGCSSLLSPTETTHGRSALALAAALQAALASPLGTKQLQDCEAGANDARTGRMLRTVFTGRDKEGHGRRVKERSEHGESPGSQPSPAGQTCHENPCKAFMRSVQCTPSLKGVVKPPRAGPLFCQFACPRFANVSSSADASKSTIARRGGRCCGSPF